VYYNFVHNNYVLCLLFICNHKFILRPQATYVSSNLADYSVSLAIKPRYKFLQPLKSQICRLNFSYKGWNYRCLCREHRTHIHVSLITKHP
jgi:hypothetical protein